MANGQTYHGPTKINCTLGCDVPDDVTITEVTLPRDGAVTCPNTDVGCDLSFVLGAPTKDPRDFTDDEWLAAMKGTTA